jgi:aminoglycoside/choline kinase family phosphotransferase
MKEKNLIAMAKESHSAHSSIIELLCQGGVLTANQCSRRDKNIEIQPLLSDGSSRRFFRVFFNGNPLCLAVFPGENDEIGRAESRAAAAVGNHLTHVNVPVPAVMAFEPERGLILFEDLGDVRLHDNLRRNQAQAQEFYPHVMKILASMQVSGAQGFDQSWCYDSPFYDQQVMLERESGYFYRAFWQDTLFGQKIEGLDEEFGAFAELTAQYFEPLFLHRDFQSRNIMIKDGKIRIIDFQAGRLGPPGYDVASLLIDPYASLSDTRQDELFEIYLDEIKAISSLDGDTIRNSYPYLAIQRNLQIIGAFAFLSGRKRKVFFLPFILPSLISLHNRLAAPMFDSFPLLRKTVSEGLQRYRSHIKG